MKRQRIKQKVNTVDESLVTLLETQLSKLEHQVEGYRGTLEKLEERTLLKDMMGTSQGSGILGAVYSKTLTSKAAIVRQVDKIKDTSIYTALVDVLVNDALAPNVATKDILKLTSKNKDILKCLDDLQENINLDDLAVDIADDFLAYGEYFVGIETEEDKGVTAIIDNVGQGEVVAIYKSSQPVYYLEQIEREFKIHEPDKYAHFCLGRRRLRIQLEGSLALSGKKGTAPEYVRIGRPLFYGNFREVANLNLLSSLVPASHLHKINSTSLIGITVPEQTDPEQAFKICRKYEKILNKTTSYDSATGDMTTADILSNAGKFKILPLYGGERGNLQKMDPRFEEMSDISMIQELKKDICGSLGVPYSFIYGGELPKGEQLKQFARYVRKLLMIQMAIGNGYRHLGAIHCRAKGKIPAPGHIEVNFMNALISVDELDKMEFTDLLGGTLNTVVDAIYTIAEKMKATIDNKIMGTFVNRYLKLMNLENVLTFPSGKTEVPIDKEGEEEEEEEEEVPIDKEGEEEETEEEEV